MITVYVALIIKEEKYSHIAENTEQREYLILNQSTHSLHSYQKNFSYMYTQYQPYLLLPHHL